MKKLVEKNAFRKLFLVPLVLALSVSSLCITLAGCSTAKETLEGTTTDLLPQLNEKTLSHLTGGDALYMTFDDALTVDNCLSLAGLTPDEFGKYVEDATVSQAAIMSIAHQVVLIKCNSSADAQTVKGLIADGFDTNRWICVFPERCLVQESGSYVLFVASTKAMTEAYQAGFSDLADSNVGTADVFFVFATE
ncbi:MAG: hypothetical protein LBU61_02450 [Coriobacteriales bacterium]|jgi:hypothetical protein|nr:hypothetical protein [Coriobacteriales bacterium]